MKHRSCEAGVPRGAPAFPWRRLGFLVVLPAVVLAPAWPAVRGTPPASAAPASRATPPASPAEPPAAAASHLATVDRVLRSIRSTEDYPPVRDAVALLLLDYADRGDAADLARAEALARMAAPRGARTQGSLWPFYAVAKAGGNTLADGETLLGPTRELLSKSGRRATTTSFARLVVDLFTRAAAVGSPDTYTEALTGASALFGARVRKDGTRLMVLPGGGAAEKASLADHAEVLEAAVMSWETSGSAPAREVVSRLAHELLRNFWDGESGRLRVPATDAVGLPPAVDPLLNARAALALWRAGEATGETFLVGRSRRILDKVLDEAVSYPVSAPAGALAAALMFEPPVRMVLFGDPASPEMIVMRRTCFSVFEPRRVILNLDPVTDQARIDALGLTGAAAPALYLERAGRLSGPIVDPSAVAGAVRSFRSVDESGEASPESRR